MSARIYIILTLFLIAMGSCSRSNAPITDSEVIETGSDTPSQRCDSSQFDDIVFNGSDGSLLLSGGDADSQHFDISGWNLEACNLGFCFCREHFPAVYQPKYSTIEEDEFRYESDDRFIVVRAGGKVKAYSIDLLVKHEVVNDTLDGDPYLVGYCILADLPVVYSRDYCGQTLTFALSGYTYYEDDVQDGVQAFVLWDRETESLWWPFEDEALSGPMQGAPLKAYDLFRWDVLPWADLTTKYPDALLLAADIEVDPPQNWPALSITASDCP